MKLLTASLLVSASLSALGASSDYIVLFRRVETVVSSMDHGAYQNHLQSTNQKSVTQLSEWVATRGASPTKIRDLWLAKGAIASLEEADAKKLAREPWVSGVYPSKFRKFISPQGKLTVGNTLDEVTSEPGPLWGLQKIGLDKIRAEFPALKGNGVRVAILDTGIQARHPELKGMKVQFRDFISHLTNSYDDHGHGTHVAGTIGGVNVGIAPGVSLWAGKIFAASGGGRDAEILEAMQWAFDPDGNPNTDDYPHIVSNSWGADLTGADIADISELAPFHSAVMGWIRGGIIPVFAAGNSGGTPNGFPGGFPEVIAVGALETNGAVADFSSRGPNVWRMGDVLLTVMKPDVSAPGVAIPSAFPGNKYASWAGTSMATPHVTGALALALEANPKLKLAEAKELLLRSSEKKVDNAYGYGVLDAYALVKAASAK
jgi:subtilisin family serine protease